MTQVAVGILIFDGVEVLDFAGPYEVFSRTRLVPGIESRRSDDSAPFRVFTVASRAEAIVATGGLRVIPDCDFASAPGIDILVIPGGFGTRPMLQDQPMLDWVCRAAAAATRVTSVCTGALVLAKAGLLAGQRATTHWGALTTLAELDPTIRVDAAARVVEDVVFTSAGVSAGIDMAFAVVEAMHGRAVADETAHYMDYPRRDGRESAPS
jgi:transcriptional regulator GlxA family with amidase domain